MSFRRQSIAGDRTAELCYALASEQLPLRRAQTDRHRRRSGLSTQGVEAALQLPEDKYDAGELQDPRSVLRLNITDLFLNDGVPVIIHTGICGQDA